MKCCICLLQNLLHGVGGIVDPGNKQQWRSIHKVTQKGISHCQFCTQVICAYIPLDS